MGRIRFDIDASPTDATGGEVTSLCDNSCQPGGRGSGSTIQLFETQQRADEALVVAPAHHRVPEYLLPDLPEATRHHGTVRLLKFETVLIPAKTDKFQHPAGPSLLIGDQFLVRYLQNRSRWKYFMPVRHQAPMLPVVVSQIGQVHGEGHRQRKLLEITGQAGVDWISLHVDDASIGEDRVNQA